MSRPQTRKAPTAALKPPSTMPELASSAAPGVDQATLTGSRVTALRMTAHTPIEIDKRHQPGCGLCFCRADAAKAVKDDGEGAGEADKGDQADP